jgi:hypothetical protein
MTIKEDIRELERFKQGINEAGMVLERSKIFRLCHSEDGLRLVEAMKNLFNSVQEFIDEAKLIDTNTESK